MSGSDESDFHMMSDGSEFGDVPAKKTAAKGKGKAVAEPKAKVSEHPLR
jgi:hypothetical protein